MATIAPDASNFRNLDANKYATKKTIAQGLLDVALLTANASQLKYILQVGEKHEFYTLMLTLIIISIVLQLFVAILFVIIGGLNINKDTDHTAAIILNDVILIFVFIISLVNIIISGFGMEYSSYPLRLLSDNEKVSAALLAVIMSVMVIQEDTKQNLIANILNHVSLAFVTGALFCDVIKMNFGLDPALAVNSTHDKYNFVIQGIVCIFVGTGVDINENEDMKKATWANNIILGLNTLLVVVNVLISTFEMSQS